MSKATLERDDFSSNRHPALSCLSMSFFAKPVPPSGQARGQAFAGHALGLALGVIVATVMTGIAAARDALRVAVGQRGLWDTSISEVGQRSGIFKKHGLALEILWTQGSGETQQAVIAGSVEI